MQRKKIMQKRNQNPKLLIKESEILFCSCLRIEDKSNIRFYNNSHILLNQHSTTPSWLFEDVFFFLLMTKA